MPTRPTLPRASCFSQLGCWLLVACALVGSGCANFRLPRIDPTGERLFLPCDAPYPVQAVAPAVVAPGAAQWGISVSPSQVIAPVGSEVVMIASVCGQEGFMLTRQRVEWMLAPDGVGQFMTAGEHEPFSFYNWWNRVPRKLDNQYVVNATIAAPQTLDRGTPTPTDDIVIQSGQAWVSVTSPTEGTSRVTVFAPEVLGWDRRQQTATIYWVDAQWRFPPPKIAPVGSRSVLTTSVTRQSDNTPLPGWVVRFEIAGGPEAGFAPEGATSVEVLTDAAGNASAEIFQRQPTAGTNQINIQVIRPVGPGGQTRPLPLGSGSTLHTWTSTDLQIRASGPSQAAVGSTITYRLEVTNPAASPVTDVVIADQPPAGWQFVDSSPPATSAAGGQEWRVGELAAGGTSSIEVRYRSEQAGTWDYCASATSAAGTTSRACVSTSVLATAPPPVVTPPVLGPPPTSTPPPVVPGPEPESAPAQLEVTITGPESAAVGSDVLFTIQVANRGAAPATGILVTNRFDAGLQHARAESPIERDLADLQPGGVAQMTVAFRVTTAGELCQEVDVTASGGVQAAARKCLTAYEPEQPQPEPQPLEPEAEQGGAAPAPLPTQPPLPTATQLRVIKRGPESRRVGETALFSIEVTNGGQEALRNVEIADNFETSLEPTQATEGSTWLRGNTLGWRIESLEPGQTVRRAIEFRCLRETPKSCNRVTVTADGIAPLGDEACLAIVGDQPAAAVPAEPLSVTVADTADPIRTGGETTYQVLVTNKTGQSLFDVALTITLSEELRLENASGPVRGSVAPKTPTTVVYDPVREFRAGEAPLSFELRVRGAKPGAGRVQVQVTSRGQAKPVIAEQTTEVLAE